MKKTLLAAATAAGLGCAQISSAANWLELQGNEPANAPALTLWGFIQPTYMASRSTEVTGLTGPAGITRYNGHDLIPNLVAPDYEHGSELFFQRARPGIRGVMPFDSRINYFLLAELGKNGLTREQDVVLSDASLTFNYIPGARLRAGLFKLPTGEEALQAVHTLDYVNFTNVTDSLLNERIVIPASAAPGRTINIPAGLAGANVVGSTSGFRDIGIQAYDWLRRDHWEYAYALMVSNGAGINHVHDNNGSKDVTLRLQTAYVFGGDGPRREDVTAYLWHQEGKRAFGSRDYNRVREGVGARYLRNGLRLGGEYMRGSGMIFTGPQPPFNDAGAPAFEPLNAIALESANRATGWYLDAGWRFLPKWEADLRYDTLDRLPNSAANERRFNTWTVGLQYFFNPKARVTFNYEFREQKVPNPGAITPAAQSSNAQAIANALSDRASLQLTWIF
jgi:hypothetical protein